jgi:hypothetical protein
VKRLVAMGSYALMNSDLHSVFRRRNGKPLPCCGPLRRRRDMTPGRVRRGICRRHHFESDGFPSRDLDPAWGRLHFLAPLPGIGVLRLQPSDNCVSGDRIHHGKTWLAITLQMTPTNGVRSNE